MKIGRSPSFSQLTAFFLAGGLAAVYLSTIAPDLTWANGGSDGGDLIAAAATGGVAHPTGYPVYLLLARLFQSLPLGPLAFRTNLLSAVCTVAAAVLCSAVVQRALRSAGPLPAAWGGLAAGAALGLAPLVWSQAVITEVYALNLLFVALLLWQITRPAPWSRARAGLLGLVQGLAMGNQILAGLLLPATFACAVHSSSPWQRGKPRAAALWGGWRFDGPALVATGAGLLLGLSSYAVLPLRAAAHPAVNWGDPVSLDRFLWLVSGRLYQDQLLQVDLGGAWGHVRAWAALTVQAFGVPGLIAALAGLVVFFRRSRLHLVTLWIALVFASFAIQYEVVDSYVYLLPTFLAFAVWIGLGVGETLAIVRRSHPLLPWIMGCVGVAWLAVMGAGHWPQIDASQDLRAGQFGRQVLAAAPPDAMLFARGDQAIFSLWYFHYALRQRPDLAVIANDLLPFDWYRLNLRYTYPALSIPASTVDPWLATIPRANPARPACYVFYPEKALNCR